MTEATKLYTKVFSTLTQRWSDVSSFRRVVELGLPSAARQLANANLEFVTGFLADPGNETLFLNKEAFLKTVGGPRGMGQTMTANQLAACNASVDRASMVFMHSAVDGAAYDLCKVVAMVAPTDWEPFLKNQKIALSDVKQSTYDSLFAQRLNEHLSIFERESLLKKVDRLFQLSKPPGGYEPIRNYKFDRDRLEVLDRFRHDVIHGDDQNSTFRDVHGSLDFLFHTGIFLVALVNNHYGVKLDPFHWVKIQASSADAKDS